MFRDVTCNVFTGEFSLQNISIKEQIQMTFPPDIYLIGAQKSGTTTLAYWLSQHPQLCVSDPKEPHFFSRNWSKGLTWYQSKFSNYQNAICIDASVSYSAAPLSVTGDRIPGNFKSRMGVPQRLHSINPDAKFIYLLRNPIQRTYSSYCMSVNLGREGRCFADAIKSDTQFIDMSDYYGQLSLWLEYFPLESFRFLLFEDLIQTPQQVVKQCLDFMGVKSEGFQFQPEAKNQTRCLNKVGRKFRKFCFQLDDSERGYLIPSLLREVVFSLTTNAQGFPKMQPQERNFLQEYFAEKKSKLQQLTGLSLHQWQLQ